MKTARTINMNVFYTTYSYRLILLLHTNSITLVACYDINILWVPVEFIALAAECISRYHFNIREKFANL